MARLFLYFIGIYWFAVAGVWMGTSGSVQIAEAATALMVIHEGARPVNDQGYVMFVDRDRGWIVVNEKTFVIGAYRLNHSVRFSRLENADGREAKLDQFIPGQWISVRGFGLSRYKVCVTTIRILPGYLNKEYRTLEPLKLR